MQIDAEQLWKIVNLFGLPLLLVVAFIQGWIVPGRLYQQLLVSEREFKDLAFRGTELNRRMEESARLLAAETARLAAQAKLAGES